MKIRVKFLLSAMSLVTLMVFVGGLLMLASENQILRQEMSQQHNQLIRQLARVCQESMLQSEVILFNYFKELKNQRGFHSASFINLNGDIRVHSNPTKIGTSFVSPSGHSISDYEDLFNQDYKLDDRTELTEYIHPVFLGVKKMGVARLLLNKTDLDLFIRESLQNSIRRILLVSLGVLFVGILGALWLSQTIINPIQHIVGGLKKVAKGRLQPLPKLNRKDELGWMANELNITIQKLKELDEMKQEFTASVTHELRSPLTAIERLIHLTLEGDFGSLTPEQRETMMMVSNYSIRLRGFVDDLLVQAKLDSRKVDLYQEEFDLRQSITECHKFYMPLAKEKDLNFKIDIPSDPLVVYADRVKVGQILSNLVSNAFKFTEKGNVTIQAKQDANRILIRVSDTGVGIPSKDRSQIFDKFYRSPKTARKFKGTGLGLSIVKGLVDIQRGVIKVDTNKQGGTCFTIALPAGKRKVTV